MIALGPASEFVPVFLQVFAGRLPDSSRETYKTERRRCAVLRVTAHPPLPLYICD